LVQSGAGSLEEHGFYEGHGAFERAASEVVEHVARIRMRRLHRNGPAAKRTAVWVSDTMRPIWTRHQLLGTSLNRGGYEDATFSWLLDQTKRMGGIRTYLGMEPVTLDNLWYEVSAWRASDQPRDPGLEQHFVADASGLREAKRYAKSLVEQGEAIAAEVAGMGRFVTSDRGHGTHRIQDLGEYRIPEMESNTASVSVGIVWMSPQGERMVERIGKHPRSGEDVAFISTAGSNQHQILPLVEVENEISRDTSRVRSRSLSTDREQQEQRRLSSRNSWMGFTDQMPPHQKAKSITTLEFTVSHNGVVRSRGDLVVDLIGVGYTVQQSRSFGRILTSPEGAFLSEKDLTKTGMDFAEFLTAKVR
jgi:hypothetical protein